MTEKRSLGAIIREKTADALDLPAEMVAGAPQITILGRREVQIVNHTGLLDFGESSLRFGSRRGAILVSGQALCLRAMNRFEVVICGEIDAVGFPAEEGGA